MDLETGSYELFCSGKTLNTPWCHRRVAPGYRMLHLWCLDRQTPLKPYLYRTPSGDVLDASAALKHARDIITGKSSSSVQRQPTMQLVAFSTDDPEDFKVSCDQLNAAIAEIDRAIKSFDNGMKTMEQYYGGEDRHSQQVSELLQQFGQTGNTAGTTKTTGGAVKASTVPRTNTPKAQPARPSRTLRP